MSDAVTLGRRLATFRAHSAAAPRPSTAALRRSGEASALMLADAIGGEVVAAPGGCYVRVEADSQLIPLDRDRLASLPGMPAPGAPLVCLDTETTGLSTGTGTFAFLVGLGWWHEGRFRQVQYLLPDEADEPAMLAAIARQIPADAWLVTYNGRSFDWPLLVARYRLERAAAPDHAGHLDLLPLVRRLFRHRMEDARLKTVENALLGVRRHRDVEGWEIPAFYLDFLRGGPAAPIAEIVRHNDEDVRSLARLLALLDRAYGDREARRATPRGDLAGLARAFARAGRTADALACLEDATAARPPRPDLGTIRPIGGASPVDVDDPNEPPWWSPRARPDFGGRGPGRVGAPAIRDLAGHRWTDERLSAERARLLARLGRDEEAAAAWRAAAADPGSLGVLAWIEIAKLREHRLRDLPGALDACRSALARLERARLLGRPHPRLAADLVRRGARLQRRVARSVALQTSAQARRDRAARRDPEEARALHDQARGGGREPERRTRAERRRVAAG